MGLHHSDKHTASNSQARTGRTRSRKLLEALKSCSIWRNWASASSGSIAREAWAGAAAWSRQSRAYCSTSDKILKMRAARLHRMLPHRWHRQRRAHHYTHFIGFCEVGMWTWLQWIRYPFPPLALVVSTDGLSLALSTVWAASTACPSRHSHTIKHAFNGFRV